MNIHWKDWCWCWNSNILTTWSEELIHWKRSRCWERLKVEGEGDDRGWDCWMALLSLWTWGWVSSRSWWWTGKPGMLQSMGSQRVRHNWVTELNWTDLLPWCLNPFCLCQYSLSYFPDLPSLDSSRIMCTCWYVVFCLLIGCLSSSSKKIRVLLRVEIFVLLILYP